MKRAAAVLLTLLLFHGSAQAQDIGEGLSTELPRIELQSRFASLPPPQIAQLQRPPGVLGSAVHELTTPVPQRRPGALVPLYVSFGALQALDVHSTTRALSTGAAEANPLMKGFAGNPFALSAVKAAGAAGVIYASEKIRKRNRTAAVIFMVAANAGMAFVVQHNYRQAAK
jgi:hypothetical protein